MGPQVVLSKGEEERFVSALRAEAERADGRIQHSLSSIDTRAALAWSKVDENLIRTEIEKFIPGGFAALNVEVSQVRSVRAPQLCALC